MFLSDLRPMGLETRTGFLWHVEITDAWHVEITDAWLMEAKGRTGHPLSDAVTLNLIWIYSFTRPDVDGEVCTNSRLPM